jgi:hypothetical protein
MSSEPRQSIKPEIGYVADPEFPWRGGNPYEVLNQQLRASKQLTLGPMASAAGVNKAGFSLQAAGRKVWEQLRPFWDQLRMPRTRLRTDFFHYPVSNLKIENLDPSAWEKPMPVLAPDPMSIAETCIEFPDPAQPSAETIATHEIAAAELIDFTFADLFPTQLCSGHLSLSDIVEADDDE